MSSAKQVLLTLLIGFVLLGCANAQPPGAATSVQINPIQTHLSTANTLLEYAVWINNRVYLAHNRTPIGWLPGDPWDSTFTPGTPARYRDYMLVGLSLNPNPTGATPWTSPQNPIWIDPQGIAFQADPNWVLQPGWPHSSGTLWHFNWLGGPQWGGSFGMTVYFQVLRLDTVNAALAGSSNLLTLTL